MPIWNFVWNRFEKCLSVHWTLFNLNPLGTLLVLTRSFWFYVTLFSYYFHFLFLNCMIKSAVSVFHGTLSRLQRDCFPVLFFEKISSKFRIPDFFPYFFSCITFFGDVTIIYISKQVFGCFNLHPVYAHVILRLSFSTSFSYRFSTWKISKLE